MTQPSSIRKFPCAQCGADAEFTPGVGLSCPFCGHSQGEPKNPDDIIEEFDFDAFLKKSKRGLQADRTQEIRCEGCGATSTVSGDAMGTACAFCGAPVVVEVSSEDVIRPEGVVPFAIAKDDIRGRFKKWVSGLWFAPNALKKLARAGRVEGVYRPFWTYDAATHSWYTGQRGEYYYVNESYTDSEGKRRTRRKRKTRWYPASGEVRRFFDDVLVSAGKPLDWRTEWDLGGLKPYDPGFLAGWAAERYTIEPDGAWPDAQEIMDKTIRQLCRQDIGGDEQRIHDVRTSYDAVKFKHILLPLYLSAYNYKGKTYRFHANGQTGEVRGERPYSFWKIFFFVLTLLAATGGLVFLFSQF